MVYRIKSGCAARLRHIRHLMSKSARLMSLYYGRARPWSTESTCHKVLVNGQARSTLSSRASMKLWKTFRRFTATLKRSALKKSKVFGCPDRWPPESVMSSPRRPVKCGLSSSTSFGLAFGSYSTLELKANRPLIRFPSLFNDDRLARINFPIAIHSHEPELSGLQADQRKPPRPPDKSAFGR